jgi:LemA protein
MKKGLIIGLIAVVVIVLILFGKFIAINNTIVQLDENIDGAWAQVETVLQRRYDLIPNLVNTVKGYATHEKELLQKITELRSQWSQADTLNQKTQAANGLEGALSRLMVVVENYPDLKANQNFLALQDELAGTENRISVERRRYNEAVKGYNSYIRQFPACFIAGMRGFTPRDVYFESTEPAKKAPEVSF